MQHNVIMEDVCSAALLPNKDENRNRWKEFCFKNSLFIHSLTSHVQPTHSEPLSVGLHCTNIKTSTATKRKEKLFSRNFKQICSFIRNTETTVPTPGTGKHSVVSVVIPQVPAVVSMIHLKGRISEGFTQYC